jgi:hypothetical protein
VKSASVSQAFPEVAVLFEDGERASAIQNPVSPIPDIRIEATLDLFAESLKAPFAGRESHAPQLKQQLLQPASSRERVDVFDGLRTCPSSAIYRGRTAP